MFSVVYIAQLHTWTNIVLRVFIKCSSQILGCSGYFQLVHCSQRSQVFLQIQRNSRTVFTIFRFDPNCSWEATAENWLNVLEATTKNCQLEHTFDHDFSAGLNIFLAVNFDQQAWRKEHDDALTPKAFALESCLCRLSKPCWLEMYLVHNVPDTRTS